MLTFSNYTTTNSLPLWLDTYILQKVVVLLHFFLTTQVSPFEATDHGATMGMTQGSLSQLYIGYLPTYLPTYLVIYELPTQLSMGYLHACRAGYSLPLKNWKTRSVSVTLWACHLHLKISILLQKKNYGNSNNISPCKNIIFKKIL